MSGGERFGHTKRVEDAFKRFTAPRPRPDRRDSSPDDFNFINARDRRKNSPSDSRAQQPFDGRARLAENFNPAGDRYRPSDRPSERSISPPDVRSSFRRGRQSPRPLSPRDSYRDNPRSPEAARAYVQRETSPRPLARDYRDRRDDDSFESRRYDHWDRREPFAAPVRRDERDANGSSPVRSRPTQPKAWHSSPPVPPLNDTRSPADEHPEPRSTNRRNGTLFRNLSWTKPRSPPRYPAEDVIRDEAAGPDDELLTTNDKAEFNGLKDVPTGPAKKEENIVVPDLVRNLPHIFISSRFIPANTKTTPHLAKFVQLHGPAPLHVVGNETGYFIAFADTQEGRSQLHQCERSCKGKKFFSMYCLVMKPFPYGQPLPHGRDDEPAYPTQAFTARSHALSAERVSSPNLDMAQSQVVSDIPEDQAWIDGEQNGAIALEESERGADSSIPTPKPTRQVSLDTLRANRPHLTWSLSPRGGSTSSISGRTVSDISGRGSRRCHVCKDRSEADVLVSCTTCSRRYHRRCHTKRPIPVVPGDKWQCRRCERKKVPLSRKKSSSTEMPAGSEASVDVPDDGRPILSFNGVPANDGASDLPAVRDGAGLDKLGLEESSGHQQIQTASLPPEQTIPNHTEPNSDGLAFSVAQESVEVVEPPEPAQIEHPMAPTQEPPLKPPPAGSDDAFTALQDLVDQSFAAPVNDNVQGGKKPGKLQLIRRKKPTQDDAEMREQGSRPPDAAVAKAATANETERNTDIYPRFEGPEKSNGPPHDTVCEGQDQKPIPDLRDSVASASPVDSVVPAIKRTRKPGVAMAPCSGCGARTAKPPRGDPICTQCKRKSASKITKEAPMQDVRSASLQMSRETSHVAAEPAMLDDVPPNATVEEPSQQALSAENNGEQVSPTFTAEQQNLESHDGDVPMEDRSNHSDKDMVSLFGDADMADDAGQIEEETMAYAEHAKMEDEAEQRITEERETSLGDADMAVINAALDAMEQDNLLAQASLDALVPASGSQRKTGYKRKSQRSVPTDKNDLGNFELRPKGTYWRLMALALCDLPGDRHQPRDVIEWVSSNVPGYVHKEKEGSWADGLKSTMIMNVQGRSGPILATREKWKDGDPGEEGKDWWTLLPGIKDKVEHWNHSDKCPVPPIDLQPGWTQAAVESDVDSAVDGDIESPQQALASKTPSRPGKLKPVKRAGRKRVKQAAALPFTDAMDMDEPLPEAEPEIPKGTLEFDTSDEETLASNSVKRKRLLAQQKELLSAFQSAKQRGTPSKGQRMEAEKAPLAPSGQASNVAMPRLAPVASAVEDDLGIRGLILEEVENRDFSAKNLDEWPEYRSTEHSTRQKQKIMEIRARPTRKQLFGAPASASILQGPGLSIRPPSSGPSVALSRQSDKFADFGIETQEIEKPCKTLDEFLGIREDVQYVPHIADRYLAYKVPGVRGSNKTDIRCSEN